MALQETKCREGEFPEERFRELGYEAAHIGHSQWNGVALLSRVGLTLTDTGDMGSLEEDLRALLLAFRRVLRHPMIRRIIADLNAEGARDPSLEEAIRPFQQARRDRVQYLIERAIARGEVTGTAEREMLLDLLAGPIYWRLVVTGGRSDLAHIERLVRGTAAALKAG